MKVLFSGGGTLGPVTPLLAIHEVFEDTDNKIQYLWVGTKNGPEKEIIETNNIRFRSISSGKFRRYFSLLNLVDLFKIVFGFFQSCYILWVEDPDICISAGGFVSVPIHFAAWFFGVPTWVHQQDIRVGLANKIMSFTARVITTATEENTHHFKKSKVLFLGNPVRQEILSGNRDRARAFFNLTTDLPVVFVTGGGTGSARVNQIVVEAVQSLQGVCEIIHLTGKERPQEMSKRMIEVFPHYRVYDFFTSEMRDAYAVADLVISRGGFGTLAELSALGKPAIIIPKHGHQEDNVNFLGSKEAVIVLDENLVNGYQLSTIIKKIFSNKDIQKKLSERVQIFLPQAKREDIVRILRNLVD